MWQSRVQTTLFIGIASAAVALAACTGGSRSLPGLPAGPGSADAPGTEGAGALSALEMNALMPTSVRPDSAVPPPMPTIAPGASIAGQKGATRSGAALSWTPITGQRVTSVAVSPLDGTLWGIGPLTNGADGAIVHYANGNWTQFTTAAAGSVAVDSRGSVFAVNRATHALYEYPQPGATAGPGAATPLPTQTWVPLGTNMSSVSVTSNGIPVALANDQSAANQAVWIHAPKPGATGLPWQQLAGQGSNVAGSFDPNGEVIQATPTVVLLPGGFFLVHSSGGIFYYNFAGATPGYAKFPAVGAGQVPASSGVAESAGILYAMSYPSSTGGNTISAFNYATSLWTKQGTYLAAGIAAAPLPSATPALYSFDASGTAQAGAIATPTPTPQPNAMVPMTVSIDPGATSANPKMSGGTTNVYVYGQAVPLPAPPAPPVWVMVTNATGATVPFPVATGSAAPTATVPPIPFYGGSTTTGSTSQTIMLPPLNSARIYVSKGPLAITTTSGPAPWTLDGSQTTFYDFAEFSWDAPAATFYVDTTQVNSIGLDLTLTLTGIAGTQQTGLKAGAITQVASQMASVPSPAPWQVLTSQLPYRILSPDGLVYGTSSTPGTLPGFYPGNFNDSALLAAWNLYVAPNWLEIDGVGGELGAAPIYGQVDANGNFNFYRSESATGTPFVTIPSPFNSAYQFGGGVLNMQGYPATWGTATQTVFLQNGPFLLPSSIQVLVQPSGSPAPAPVPTTYTWPQNSAAPNAAGTIGNKVSTALNRGIFSTNPIVCPPPATLFLNAPYQNQYAAVVTSVAKTFGYGQSYTIPYNDQCGLSTTIQDPRAASLSITIFSD